MIERFSIRRTLIPVFASFLALSGASAWAVDHWVAVGSYSSEESALAARTDAQAQLGEPAVVAGSDTGTGYFHRVLAGPYADATQAAEVKERAQLMGFAGAWVLADADGRIAGSALTSGYDLDLDDSLGWEPSSADGRDDADYDLPDEGYGSDGPIEGAEERTMVEEPPPGYRLHKLRRDAQARPPPEGRTVEDDAIEFDLNTGPTLRLSRLPHASTTIKIDGKLDEPAWASAVVVNDFHAVEPPTAEPAHLETDLRLFYTEKGLYAGFDLEQDPETFVRWIVARDLGFESGDHVGITLDTSGDGLYGYWMSVSIGDVQSDGTLLPERRFSRDWDGAWYGRAAHTERGWSAEFFVPWSQVSMPVRDGVRRMGLYASRKYSKDDVRWGVPTLPPNQARFITAMRPMEMEGVAPQQQWSVIPYASFTQDEVENRSLGKAGAEVFWRPTSNFQLSATLNPDFGNVESDDVVVNLSPFEVFFRERRLFFLEGREIFETTPRSDPFRNREPITIVNTRRIGGAPRAPNDVPDGLEVPLRELAQPTELLGAAKVTGQLGNLRYGVLAASEDEVKFDVESLNLKGEGSDYGVARLLYEDSSGEAYRAIGMISTMVAHPDQDAMVHGVDLHYRTPGSIWSFDGQLLYSDKDEVGQGYGGFADVVYAPRRGLKIIGGVSHFDERLDISDLGFLRRNDASNISLRAEHSTTSLGWAREFVTKPFTQWEINGDGDHTRRGIGSDFTALLNNLGRVDAAIAYFPERDEDRASFGNGTYIIEGRHDTRFEYSSNEARRLSYKARFEHDGEELGGRTLKGSVGLVWRPADRITLDLRAEYWDREGWLLHQEDRNFTTFDTREWRPRVGLEYNFSARQQLKLVAQWVAIKAREREFFLVPERVDELIPTTKPDAESDDFSISNLNIQLRYRWEIAPLSDLFVVYTLGGVDRTGVQPFDTLFEDTFDNPDVEQFVVKLRYRFGS